MAGSRPTAPFIQHLHRALRYLYDPTELGKSPLLELLGLQQRHEPPAALRNALTEAIASLKPDADAPPQSNAWRVYHILSQRYVEQFTQQEVATNLALSTRQLGRLEKQAIQVLAGPLWSHYGVATRVLQPAGHAPHSAEAAIRVGGETPSREQELQWLKASYPSEPVDCLQLVEAVLKVVAPLAQALGVHTACRMPQHLPRLAVQVTTVRQALVNILTATIRCVPGGAVRVEADVQEPQVQVLVRPTRKHPANSSPAAGEHHESLELAGELARLSGGSMEVLPGADWREPFAVRIVLPAMEQVTVLVVDDNVDTLHLLERYLAGSRYRFVGTADPLQALALAEEVRPQLVVLDVMLPGVDGWELVARFREHPILRQAPLLVCTILPQEELASILGAAALVRKPVTQLAFLAALDQQWERMGKVSR